MAFTVTSVAHAKELLERANDRAKRIQSNAEQRAGMFLHTAESLGMTAAFGFANNVLGKDGVLAVGGVPLDGVVGVALHVAATYGAFGKHDEHMHWLGTGAIAAWIYRQTAMMGAKMAAKNREPQGAAALPYPYPVAMMGPGTPMAPGVAPMMMPPGMAYPPPYAPPPGVPVYPGAPGVPQAGPNG